MTSQLFRVQSWAGLCPGKPVQGPIDERPWSTCYDDAKSPGPTPCPWEKASSKQEFQEDYVVNNVCCQHCFSRTGCPVLPTSRTDFFGYRGVLVIWKGSSWGRHPSSCRSTPLESANRSEDQTWKSSRQDLLSDEFCDRGISMLRQWVTCCQPGGKREKGSFCL